MVGRYIDKIVENLFEDEDEDEPKAAQAEPETNQELIEAAEAKNDDDVVDLDEEAVEGDF